MSHLDLFDLRESFSRRDIMICFNGPFSRSIIEELGNAVRRYLEDAAIERGAMMDVFSVYIEQTQNVRNYVSRRYPDDLARQSAIVLIGRDGDRYAVCSGNLIDPEDASRLGLWIDHLRRQERAGLKALYKERLRAPRAPGETGGAGLGLIDMARKAAHPLEWAVRAIDPDHAFFSLRVVI